MGVFKVLSVLVCFLTLCVPIFGDIFFQKGAPRVKLSGNAGVIGTVKFSREGRPYSAFLGIPFAEVPDRFQAPVLRSKPTWEGFRNSTTAGPVCPQRRLVPDKILVHGDENCLNLNVYIPMSHSGRKDLAVIVWAHGGGLEFGSGSSYGAKFFMDEDVILVTINYRLGIFGFLSTGDQVVPGNNGLKDQVAALKWVKENIGKFGGNQNSITVVGESAGGALSHYLLLSETTKGLFHRVISQSGSALNHWAYDPNPRRAAVNLSNYLKCRTTSKDPNKITSQEMLACFDKLSNDELVKAQFEFSPPWPLHTPAIPFAPVAESGSSNSPFLTMSPMEILRDNWKSIQKVAWMTGVTEDEGFFIAGQGTLSEAETKWIDVAAKSLHLDKYFSSFEQTVITEKLRKFYFQDKQISPETLDEYVKLYSDAWFLFGVRKAALEMAAKGHIVYLYEYAFNAKSFMETMHIPTEGKKVGHAEDLFTLFDRTGLMPPEMESSFVPPDSPEEEFSRHFVRLWASFAKNGEPRYSWGNNRDRMWRPLSKREIANEDDQLKWYQIDSAPSYIEETESVTERMEFWEKLWQEHFEPVIFKEKGQEGKTEL